jgi:hypothetical protein
MKKRLSLITGLFLLCTFQLLAQNGSTTTPGQNPVAPSQNARVGDPDPTPQDGNGQLGPVYQATECGLDFTTATQKLGQRFFPPGVPQPATFTIGGIPGGAVIQRAFVWADASGNGTPLFNLNVVNSIGMPFTFPMPLVGSAADKCWGYAGSFTYRADITPCISGNGNYQISGLPTNPPSPGNDVDGATMMVIWSDPAATFQGNIVIWDGALVGIGTPVSQTLSGFQACNGNIFNARAFCAVGDLQGFGSPLVLNGGGPYFVAEDWWNYLEVSTVVNPGQNTSVFGNNMNSGDCYNFCLAGLYWQADCNTTCYYPCEAKPDFKWDGCNPVQFDGFNTGVSPTVSWFWQFGDGQTSTLEDPLHSYAAPGMYKVCLSIMSKGSNGETCCEQICYDVDVCQAGPCEVKAEFKADPSPVKPAYTMIFTDYTTYSGGTICNYYIDYGDGSPIYSGPTFPTTHTYPGPGWYNVCMTVTVCVYDAAGNLIDKCDNTVCKEIFVNGQIVISPNKMGNNNTNTDSNISVFPSPTSQSVNVIINDMDNATVTVINSNGQEVAKATAAGKNTYMADVSGLASGVYFIMVKGPDGKIRKQEFVVQK